MQLRPEMCHGLEEGEISSFEGAERFILSIIDCSCFGPMLSIEQHGHQITKLHHRL